MGRQECRGTRKTVILVFHSFGTWELQEKTTKHEQELTIQNHINLKVKENLESMPKQF